VAKRHGAGSREQWDYIIADSSYLTQQNLHSFKMQGLHGLHGLHGLYTNYDCRFLDDGSRVTVHECKFHVNTNRKISNGINNNLKDGMEGQRRPEIPLRCS
jgi:hypothetical protein